MMKETAIQILARAIHDAGAQIVTSVPGTGATQVIDAFCRIAGRSLPYSFHEEVARAIAHGRGGLVRPLGNRNDDAR